MRHIILSFCVVLPIVSQAQRTVGLIQHDAPPPAYLLFPPLSNTHTYLIDPCGMEVHQWNSTYTAGASAQLQPDGTLYRAGNVNNPIYQGGGRGGVLERWSWDGDLLWSYPISNDSLCQHHDFTVLPNGNLLVIAWDRYSGAEAIAQGRNPANTGNWLLSERILELQPVGTDEVVLVWEWKLWDHLVQSFNAALPNYDVVADHPERMNLNYYGGAPMASDWIHLNGIDYNAEFDQILVSSHAIDEIWVIDHSTTTAEAAGSTGGNSGRGGDLLYRWGNPLAYGRGTVADQRLFGQHHATWLPTGHPEAGKILVFNNGLGRPAGQFSTLDIIEPAVDGSGVYDVPATTAFLPTDVFWSWSAPVPTDFFAMNIGGVFAVDDGYLATEGPEGRIFFIDGNEEQTWEYINPVNNAGPVSQGDGIAANNVFRCEYYPYDFAGFAGHDLTPGVEIELDPLPSLCLILGVEEEVPGSGGHSEVFPNPANDRITVASPGAITGINLIDVSGRSVALPFVVQSDRASVDVGAFAPGAYTLQVLEGNSSTPRTLRFVIAR